MESKSFVGGEVQTPTGGGVQVPTEQTEGGDLIPKKIPIVGYKGGLVTVIIIIIKNISQSLTSPH